MDAVKVATMKAQEIIDEILRYSSDNNIVTIGILEPSKLFSPILICRNGNSHTIADPMTVVVGTLYDEPVQETGYHFEKYRFKCDNTSALVAIAAKQLPSKSFYEIFMNALEDEFSEISIL